jgi:thioredoxin 1
MKDNMEQKESRSSSEGKDLVKHITDDEFEQEVINSEIPVFVDFWAPWCGPCRMVAPIIEELAKEYAGKCKFVKVNTDENPAVASALGIRSIPTLVIFKGNRVLDAAVGALPKGHLVKMIDRAIGEKKIVVPNSF